MNAISRATFTVCLVVEYIEVDFIDYKFCQCKQNFLDCKGNPIVQILPRI